MNIPELPKYEPIKSNLHLIEAGLWTLVFVFSVLFILIT